MALNFDRVVAMLCRGIEVEYQVLLGLEQSLTDVGMPKDTIGGSVKKIV
jgi:hypothetical protein